MPADVAKPLIVSDARKLKALAERNLPLATELCRMLMFHNMLMSLNRMYAALLKQNESEQYQQELVEGDRAAHYFLTIGVLKEALDAFHEFNGHRWISQQKSLQRDSEFQRIRANLIETVDKDNPNSFYCRYIRPTRDDAVFHLDRNIVQQSLEQLASKTEDGQLPKLLVGYSSKARDFRFPIGDQLWLHLPPWNPNSQEEMEKVAEKVAEVSRDFCHFTARLVHHMLVE